MLGSTRFFSMKISNKRHFKQFALHHSSDFEFKDFIKTYKKYAAEPYSFLVNITALQSDNVLRLRKILQVKKYYLLIKNN